MKIKTSKVKVRDDIKWFLTATHIGERKRKFFSTALEAGQFDALIWINQDLLKKPCGINTVVDVAITEYIADYERRHPRANTQQQKNRLEHLKAFEKVRAPDSLESSAGRDYFLP